MTVLPSDDEALDIHEPSDAIPDELSDLFEGLEALADAEPEYREAAAFFDGTAREVFASPKIERKLARTGAAYRLNIAKKAVTSVTDRLEVASATVMGNEALTKLLAQNVIEANDLELEFPRWIENAGKYGDAYIFVWPGDEPGTVDVEYSGPLTTRAMYDPEHPRRIRFVIKSWEIGPMGRRRRRANLYYEDRIEKWVTLDGTNGSSPEDWESYEDDLENEWGRPPVFHLRTARPYGRPLHRDAYGPQNAINKLVITMMGTTDFQGFPQRAALVDASTSADGESEDADDFDDFTEDDTLAGAGTGDQRSKLKSGPGEVWWLKNVRNLVQLPPADPKVFLDPADFFLRMMATSTDTPLHFYDPGGDQPSGDSRRQAEGTLTKKIDRVSKQLERTLEEVLTFAMRVLGHADARVNVTWAAPETVDDNEGWQTVKLKIDAGVPKRQALIEAGYEPEQVDEWIKQAERDGQLGQLGKTVSMLKEAGVAQQLGAISPEALQGLVARLAAPGEADPSGPPRPANGG